MKDDNKPLSFEFSGLFRNVSCKKSPVISANTTGILINVDDFNHDGQHLTCKVLISYKFEQSFVKSFHKIDWSMILVIDDLSSGKGLAFPLRDPHKRYTRYDGPNYKHVINADQNLSYVGGYLEIPISVELSSSYIVPSVFISVLLHQFQSNRIGLDFKSRNTLNFVNGLNAHLQLVEDRIIQ